MRFGIVTEDALDQPAFLWLASYDRLPIDRRRAHVEPQFRLALFGVRSMTREALVRQERPNVAVTGLRATQPQMVATIDSRLVASISNFGTQTFEGQALRVYLNDAAQPTVPVPTILPGQSADVAIDITFPEDDFQQVRVRQSANPKNREVEHWFLGEGMVHGVRLEALR